MMLIALNSQKPEHSSIISVSLLLILLLSCLTTGLALAEVSKAAAIHDLRYREALYYSYQKKYFSAITCLPRAGNHDPVRRRGDMPEILPGSLYQRYGLSAESRRLFTELLKNNTNDKTREKIRYYLGKSYYQQGDYDLAGDELNRITGALLPIHNEERINLLVNIYLHQGKPKQAMGALKELDSRSIWKHYARFNLGVALIKSGQTEKGQDLLEDNGDITARNDELAALRDRANLALGFSYIRQQKSKKAVEHLRKIRLVGPFSNKALLGLGWAYRLAGDRHHALSAWRELAKRDPADPAVQEALVAIPYSSNTDGAPERALTEYRKTAKIYDREQARLEAAIKAVKRGKIESVLRTDTHDPEIITALEIKKAAPIQLLPYLGQLLADYKFQAACKNYRDLLYLRHVLANWRQQLPVLQTLLRKRKQAGAILPTTRETKISLPHARKGGPKRFRAYSAQFKHWQRKINYLNVRLDALLRAQAHQLQSLAMAKLHEHQQQLKNYQIRVQYNTSLLLDKLSSDNYLFRKDRR